MNGVAVQPWIIQAIAKEVDAWSVHHSHASIESAIDDYRLLLFRNRELEEQMSRLRGACQKLQVEKRDLLEKVSELHADAQARRELVEVRARLAESQAHNEKLEKDLADYHQKLGSTTEHRDRLQSKCTTQKTELEKAGCRGCPCHSTRLAHLTTAKSPSSSTDMLRQLRSDLAALEVDRADLQECLEGEKAARMAATEELQERLISKEQAERKAEALQAETYQLESRLLQMTEQRVREQDDIRKEFEHIQQMKKQLEATHAAAAESQSGEKPVERRGPGFRFTAFMGGIIQNAADTVTRIQEARQHTEERVSGTPRVSDAAPPSEVAVAAIFPDRLLQHHEKVHSGGAGCTGVAFSASGMQVTSCGMDGVVRLWHTHDGQMATELAGAAALRPSVNDVCFTLEGDGVLAAVADRSVTLWDINTGRVRHTLTGHTGPVTGVAQHPYSHKAAASCGEDRCIKIWTLDTGFCQRSILCASRPNAVAFTIDGLLLVSGHYDGAVRVWDAGTGSLVQEIKGVHTQQMTAVCATPSSHRMVGCGRDSVLSVIDVGRFQVIKRFHDALNFQVGQSRCAPCVSPDGSVIAVGSQTGSVLLMDIKDGSLRTKLVAHKAPVTCVAWNPRGEDCAVITASVDKAGDVVFWKSSEARVNSW